MNGNKAVLDSNAIIYASNGQIDSEKMLSGYGYYFASIISLIEVYGYDLINSAEQDIIDEIMGGIGIIELTRAVADQTIVYRKKQDEKDQAAGCRHTCNRQVSRSGSHHQQRKGFCVC